ncbi:hypothetical protein ABTK42_19780, partial [Acinetobacter baumannii]
PGLWTEAQGAAWQRIVDFIHTHSSAKVAMQLGHAGPKGATCLPWQGGDDQPLPSGGWPLIAASPQQYLAGLSPTAQAMTRDDMDRV